MNDGTIADPNINDSDATVVAALIAAPDAHTIDDGVAIEDETLEHEDVVKVEEEPTTTIDEMIEEAEAAAVAAGSDFSNENVEQSTAAATSTAETNKTPLVDPVKEEVSTEQAIDSTGAITAVDSEPSRETQAPARETKKRVRRVGRTPTRKIPKLEEKINTTLDVDVGDSANPHLAVGTMDVATDVIGAIPDAVAAVAIGPSTTMAVGPPPAHQAVLSKHDEKWHAMFQKLMEFKERNKHTLVPQCYTEDPRLGRWVHYQRVEYWIFQQKGTAKITVERIARLNNIGFEWDPQKAQWEKMFAKLKEFKKEFSHCRVPKGYDKDWELANWVRNQRLEQANLKKQGKKSRMTPERFKLLDDLGFKWSSPTPARARRNRQVGAQKEDESNIKEQQITSGNEAASLMKSENTQPSGDPTDHVPIVVPPAEPASASNDITATDTGVDETAMTTLDVVQTEAAAAAAASIVGELSAVGAISNEENHVFLQETAETKSVVEETSNITAQDAMPLENKNPVALV